MAREPNEDRKANRRGAARLAAVQALYQMDIAGTGVNEIMAEFERHWLGREVEGEMYLPAQAAHFREVVKGVVEEQRRLDPMIDAVLAKGWPLVRIETVLRAILRASSYGPVRVLVPMVASAEEMAAVRHLMNECARDLRSAGHEIADHFELGAMIEVPAAAIALPGMIKMLDFIAIGTNDLVQYTLAVDRNNDHLANLYDPLHPAVERIRQAAAEVDQPLAEVDVGGLQVQHDGEAVLELVGHLLRVVEALGDH